MHTTFLAKLHTALKTPSVHSLAPHPLSISISATRKTSLRLHVTITRTSDISDPTSYSITTAFSIPDPSVATPVQNVLVAHDLHSLHPCPVPSPQTTFNARLTLPEGVSALSFQIPDVGRRLPRLRAAAISKVAVEGIEVMGVVDVVVLSAAERVMEGADAMEEDRFVLMECLDGREHIWPLSYERPCIPGDSREYHKEISSYTQQLDSDSHSDTLHGRIPYSLSSLLTSDNHTFSDVQLLVGCKQTCFNLHRCVLSLTSPVFKAMLTIPMKESTARSITLPDISPHAMRYIIPHIYGIHTQPFPTSPNLIFPIYIFAHRFDILSLLTRSRNALRYSISKTCVVDLLIFAHLYHDDPLITSALTFIERHFSYMASHTSTRKSLHAIPQSSMYRLLESDHLRATEIQLLILAIEWLAVSEHPHPPGILRRIRWGLINTHNLHPHLSKTLHNLSVPFHNAVHHPHRPRFIGRPSATIWLPIINAPPPIAAAHKAPHPPSRHSEIMFDARGFKWSFRAQLQPCMTADCNQSRLSVNLWLEEDDYGAVWTNSASTLSKHVFPMRISARFVLSDPDGGFLHTRCVLLMFKAAGWAAGWSLMDVLEGPERTRAFLNLVCGAQGARAIRVAVEITGCETRFVE